MELNESKKVEQYAKCLDYLCSFQKSGKTPEEKGSSNVNKKSTIRTVKLSNFSAEQYPNVSKWKSGKLTHLWTEKNKHLTRNRENLTASKTTQNPGASSSSLIQSYSVPVQREQVRNERKTFVTPALKEANVEAKDLEPIHSRQISNNNTDQYPKREMFRSALDEYVTGSLKNNKPISLSASSGNHLGPANQLAPARRVGLSSFLRSKVQPQQQQPPKENVSKNPEVLELMENDSLKNIDPKMIEAILNEVVEITKTEWRDIAGLEGVKRIIKEIIIWPMQRPDIFTGLRGPPKGILLFGPPGTGKTMIGRLIATESHSSFFNISASSLTSKWIGEGEKMVRALFAVARVKQPSVIFIDEIDSILTQRSDTEHESSRRLKTEFLIQFDGCGTKSEDKILVIGVTNRPQELDEAARRRLVKRIYIPLPDGEARKQMVQNLLKQQNYQIDVSDLTIISELTEGYSGADIASLCQESSYGPIRDVGSDIQNICVDNVRPINLQDFKNSVKVVKASVAQSDLTIYQDWDHNFGCHIKTN